MKEIPMNNLEKILMKKLSNEHLKKVKKAQPRLDDFELKAVTFNYESGFQEAVELMKGDYQ